MSTFLRRTWAEVDVDAVKNNYRKIRQAVGPETQIMCVIKADAYGHGAVFLARVIVFCTSLQSLSNNTIEICNIPPHSVPFISPKTRIQENFSYNIRINAIKT